MTSIRTLRRRHGLTLIELAHLTAIPARTLAEVEYGLQRLDRKTRLQLARFYDLEPDRLTGAYTRRMRVVAASSTTWFNETQWQQAVPVAVAALAGVALMAAPTLRPQPLAVPLRAPASIPTALPGGTPRIQTVPTTAPAAAQPAAAQSAQAVAAIAATTVPTVMPTNPPNAVPAPPRFVLLEDGPHGCPLEPIAGRTVLTQGYGVGSHAPAEAWGAVDLGVDSDGDGYAEPGASFGVPVLASISGQVQVFMNSWPGGNFVRITDGGTGWGVAYGHLDTVAVADGETVEAGAQIGTTGSTGMATGPHLHYEVWHGPTNMDPTGLVGCG